MKISKYVWRAMISRCHNPKNAGYADYGGRGIEVCQEWRDSYEAFISDVGERPSPKHSIDRIDNNKGYSKDNFRWATDLEQANNKRNNRVIECDGERMSLASWGRISGNDADTIAYRLNLGWDIHDAIYRKVAVAKSGVPNVAYRQSRNTWVVRITRNKKRIFVGTYYSFFDAVCGRYGNDMFDAVNEAKFKP